VAGLQGCHLRVSWLEAAAPWEVEAEEGMSQHAGSGYPIPWQEQEKEKEHEMGVCRAGEPATAYSLPAESSN
jgi:hypothetical protein